MLNKTLAACGLALACASTGALAAGPEGSVGAFYSISEFDTGGAEKVDGDGFGIRGTFDFGGPLVAASFLSESLDDDSDYTELRVGGGYSMKVSGQARVSGQIDWISSEVKPDAGSSVDQDGIGVYFGLKGDITRGFSMFGRAGYMKLDDVDGFDGNVGFAANFSRNVGLSLEYRAARLEGDAGEQFDIGSFRAGAQFLF